MDSKELFGESFESEKALEEIAEETVAQEEMQVQEETFPPLPDLPPEQGLSPEQIQQQVQEESKKGNNGVVVAIVTLLFILVIGLCVYIAVSVSKMVPQKGQEDKEYESQTGDPWEELLGDDYIEGESEEEINEASESDVHAYPSYEESDFTGPYYENVADCIDESVSYKISRQFYDCEEEKENVFIYTSYIQLEGDIPGLEDINRTLEEGTTYFVKNYEKNKDEISKTLQETGTGIEASIKSYVTYNTENMISVVVYEDISMGYMYRDVALYCYNINLDTGTILDNSTILDLGEGFGQEFRERSNKQNGISEGGVEYYSNEEIEAMLKGNASVIIFYTPLGMELGYNYSNSSYAGWITITMQDYEEYMAKL